MSFEIKGQHPSPLGIVLEIEENSTSWSISLSEQNKDDNNNHTIPVYVEILNKYEFCGIIDIKIKKYEPYNYQFHYSLDKLINDIVLYL